MGLAKGSFGVVLAALCLLAAVEGWLALAHPLARLPVATIEQGEAFNSIAGIKKETSDSKKEPYVVLLGSSLMVAPVVQAESQYRKRPLKRFFERRATFCENELDSQLKMAYGVRPNSSGGAPVRIYNAAVGGGMASDDFFVARELLQSKNVPAALVCGVAPRDFQDNLVPGSYSTSAFQVFADVSDLGRVFSDKNLSQEKKFDIALGRFSRLWRNRSEVKSYFGLVAKKTIEKICPFILFEKYGPTLALSRQKKGVFPEEVHGTPMAYPGYAIDHYDSVKTNQQYVRSYHPINRKMVDEQFSYFNEMLDLSRRKNVDLMVVNMPLSRANKELIPPEYYADYLNRLKTACAAREVQFIDYNNAEWDENSNFIDTVHIQPEKSPAFLQALMKAVANSPLSLALSSENKRQIGANQSSTN